MTKKVFVVILVLGVIVNYIAALADFMLNISKGPIGIPFGFSNFNFFGAETNNVMLVLDITFWFIVIWGVWKVLLKLFKKS